MDIVGDGGGGGGGVRGEWLYPPGRTGGGSGAAGAACSGSDGGPVLVLATLGLANAIISEATLSFLGVGLPPTQPSLGTLIRIGNEYLFSGQWWITIFPGAALITIVLGVNLLGDWLRDALNPMLR